VILALLVAGAWVAGEWREREQLRAAIAAQAAAVAARRREIDAELYRLEARIERSERAWSDALSKFGDVERQAREARDRADAARSRHGALQRGSAWWDWVVAPERVVELERAHATWLALETRAKTWEETRDRIAPAFRESPAAALRLTRQRRLDELASLESLLAAQVERLERAPSEWLTRTVWRQLPVALGILAGLILLPVLLKALCYFVLAPLAQRLPPVRILPDPGAPLPPPPSPSAVSLPLEVGVGEELLVHPDLIQSSSESAPRHTQWLLNARLPFSSLASGMTALTCIRAEAGTTTRVVVSPRRDPFDEVAVVELPTGAAMILQPRALAGVVKPPGVPVAMSRHWRLGSLHAWLTLQLRYLAFHGPCRLVVRGCRGVHAEQPEIGRPRVINQSVMLGFSANLDYRNTRCETFVSYLRGRESLLDDVFEGAPGWFVYEARPGGPPRGLFGRGLQGVVDAFLKVLGI
jgi:hypothetical protein